MNTKEAIQAMLDGKKIRATDWHKAKNEYIFFNGKYFQDMVGSQFMFSNVEHNFEIYEEPKPKQVVTIEKWLCEMGYTIEATQEYFNINNLNKIKLLNTYEVEL